MLRRVPRYKSALRIEGEREVRKAVSYSQGDDAGYRERCFSRIYQESSCRCRESRGQTKREEKNGGAGYPDERPDGAAVGKPEREAPSRNPTGGDNSPQVVEARLRQVSKSFGRTPGAFRRVRELL